jgi:cytochrome P450
MAESDIELVWAGAEPPAPEVPEPTPVGFELTEQDEAFRATPYPRLQILRERDPVHRDARLQCHLLTRHDDVRDALANTTLWRDPRHARRTSFALGEPFAEDHPAAALTLDEPSHRAWRAPLEAALSHAAVAALVPRIDAEITLILDDIDENEFEFDAFTKYALRVATSVLADLFGVPRDRWTNFRTWAMQSSDEYYAAAPDPGVRDRAATARAELDQLFRASIAARREKPEIDLVSALLDASGADTPASQAEVDDRVAAQCQALLIAGLAPTAALLGNSLHSLLQNTRQMNRVRERPELLGNAVEEILRFNTPVISTLRIASTDMTIGGCPVARGEALQLSLAAANRDPDAYPNPDVMDVLRLDTHHQSFGGGEHVCVGAELARTIAMLAIYGLIMRFDDLETSPIGWEFAGRKSLRILKQFWVRS